LKKPLVILAILVLMINIAYASGPVKMRMQVDKNNYIVAKDNDIITKTFDTTPIMIEGTTFVPLRGIFEHFGATVDWVSETEKIEVEMDSSLIILQKDSNKALVNGNEYILSKSVTIVNKRTMIPLSSISEILGLNVLRDEASNYITISNNYLENIEEDKVTYADKVIQLQLSKSIYPSLDFMRNTIVKVWVSNSFERVDFWKIALKAQEIANVMEQAEKMYQEFFPEKYIENEIENTWKYFDLVRIGLMQMGNGSGELIDQEKDFLKTVLHTLSDIDNYKDQNLEDSEYTSLEKMILLMSVVPKPQTDLMLTENTVKPPKKLEESLTMEEALNYMNSDLNIKGYSFDRETFHLFLVEIDEEEYIVAIHKDYSRISGALPRNSLDYYKQIEFEEISIP